MPIDDPVAMFAALFERAAETCAEPDAMVLSTVDEDGRPSARYVLLKGVDDRGFVFYTNLESRKARALAAHPFAALTFYWPPESQVRIEGTVERVADADADAYFATARIPDRRLGLGAERAAGVAGGARRAGRGRRSAFRRHRGGASAVLERIPRRRHLDRVLDAGCRPAPRARRLPTRLGR
jgi:hypothetical protein